MDQEKSHNEENVQIDENFTEEVENQNEILKELIKKISNSEDTSLNNDLEQ